MFNKGDMYVRFSPYGGITIDEIRSINTVTVTDAAHGFVYKKFSIVNTKGIVIELDGSNGKIYKLENILSKEDCEKIIENMKKISFYKSNIRATALLKYGKDIDIII